MGRIFTDYNVRTRVYITRTRLPLNPLRWANGTRALYPVTLGRAITRTDLPPFRGIPLKGLQRGPASALERARPPALPVTFYHSWCIDLGKPYISCPHKRYTHKPRTILGGGSLGSCVDEKRSLIIDTSNAHGGSGLRGPCHVRLRVGNSYQSTSILYSSRERWVSQ